MSQTVFDKIKTQIKKINKRNMPYYIAVWTLTIIFMFFFLTTILQTNWFNISTLQAPILVWIIGQPYVGVFFLPFLILITYIAWFVCSIGKPITIKKVQSDTRSLFEDQQLTKPEYDDLYKMLETAFLRNKAEYEKEIQERESEKEQKSGVNEIPGEKKGNL